MKKSNTPKRVANLICAGLQIAALLMFVFTKYATYVKRPNANFLAGDLVALFDGSGVITFSNLKNSINLWPVLGIILLLLGTVMCLISALRNTSERDGVSHTVVSFLSLIVVGWVIVMMGMMSQRAETFCVITANNLSVRVIFILLGSAVVCNMLKRSSLITPKTKKKVVVQRNEPISHADELKKYKELLDSGVISQEEFDAKKKQLLDM